MWGALVCASLWACSPKSPDDPGIAVAGSREAQTELRRLEEKWELRAGPARAELRPELERFVVQYKNDPSVARARILLAQIALSERRLGSAEEILEPILRGPRGPSRDEAEVVLAAIDNRRGNHQRALSRLSPLEGKLLSHEARDQYARERTNAAIASRRWRLTVDSMIAWLVESNNSRHVKEWADATIVQVPTAALSRLLADWDSEADSPALMAANDWMQRVIIEHLSREALRARDPHLARDLLDRAPPWLRAGESGDALSVLAALAQKEARIVGRGVGVVMGGETEEVQRRSARVGMGVLQGLDLGRAGSDGTGVKMLAAENRGSTSAALGTLTGLGVSILVAGFDMESATDAIAFAESRKVPVVVMHEPREGTKSDYGFLFGVDRKAQLDAVQMTKAFADRWTLVGEGGASCPTVSARPGTNTLPWEQWRIKDVRAVLVLGDSTCCARVHAELTRAPFAPQVIFGLEGADTKSFGGPAPLRLSVGQYPEVRAPAAGVQLSEAEKEILEGKAPPQVHPTDWYFSLGVDLARLLGEALRHLPEKQVTDKEQVREHYEKARSALLDARAPLITADAQGFTSAGRIQRILRVQSSLGARK